jgi:hypothetical protein
MEPLIRYFEGEKLAASLALLLGVLSLGFAVWLYRSASPFRAMLIPLGLVGLVQIGIGVGLHVRTPGQVAALESGMTSDRPTTRNKELERMQKVMQSFKLIKAAEVALLVVALVLVFVLESRPVAVGIGMGLLVEAAVMLAFDVFAEHRGEVYLAFLQGLS